VDCLVHVSTRMGTVDFVMRDFNLLDICWKYNTAEKKQSRSVWKVTS